MGRSLGVRALAVLIIVVIVTMGFVLTWPSVQAATRTWDTDVDFNAGTLNGVAVIGTGTPASVQLLQDATDWKNEAPSSNPSAREGAAMAYDSTNARVVLFGGLGTVELSDTWVYDPSANTWTNRNPATHPSARTQAAMAFDTCNGTIVLFGGISAAANERDTWEYNVATNQWTNTTKPTAPPAMESYTMAYYSTVQRNVLVGRSTTSGAMQTWAYDVTTDTWANRVATFSPARSGQGVAYHAAFDRLVLFGGSSLFSTYGDTWEYNYNANSWTNTVADGSGPPARALLGLSYRSEDSAVWLFGGSDSGGNSLADTWRYRDLLGSRTWSSTPTQRSPSARNTFGITDITANKKSVLFGGVLAGGSHASDTWSIGPAYRSSGDWTSANADSGGANVDWLTLTWSPTSQPPGAVLRFQTQTSNDPAGPWNDFRGPNCSPSTYYVTSGTAVCASQDNARYIRVRGQLLTSNDLNTAVMDLAAVDYTVPAASPYIILTTPADTDQGVLQTAPIFVRFSEPMDNTTVAWTINPFVSLTSQWSEGNSAVTLSHTTPLLENKAYTVTITAGKDTQGFALVAGPVPNPWTFVTERVNPTITNTNPIQGQEDIALNASIVITFSEAMNRSSVTRTISPTIALSDTWSAGDTVLTLSHTEEFMQCRMHTVNITGKDLAGLPLVPGAVPNPFEFHAHCKEPFITTTSPFHLETNVAQAANIVVDFSEPMVPNTVSWTLSPLVALSPGWTNQNQTLTLTHSTPFAICQTYTANITSGKDADEGLDLFPGKHMEHAPHPWKFTIACSSPFIVVTLPPDGDTSANPTANITVQFSEAMNPASVTWSISPTITLNGSFDPGNMLLTLTHTVPFSCGPNTVLIQGTDVDGNPLIAGPAPNPWRFQPSSSPCIVQTSPADSTTGIALTSSIVITFSEAMDPLSVTWDVFPPGVSFTQTWSNGSSVLTLAPTTPLSPSRDYTVVVLSGNDTDGNGLIAGPVPNPWRFRTAGIPPRILSTTPADGTANILATADVVVDFSEAMDTATVNATAAPGIGLTYAWSNGNTTLTLSHSSAFVDCTRYMFTITGQDPDGDALVGGPVPNPWNFTTACPTSVITDTNPADTTVDVPLSGPVFVNFSQSMDTPSVRADFVPLVSVTYTWTNGGRTLRINHGTPFTECRAYTVTVSGNDTNGNSLGPGPAPNPWGFTAFCPPPQITSTVPVSGASNVATAAPVVVTFSRGMDTAPGRVTWSFVPGAGVTFAWTAGDTVLTLTPSPAPLAQCSNYQVTIGGKSKEGKDLVAGSVPNPWSFSTTCPVSAPGNLRVSRLAPDVVQLTWNAVASADFYRVYESSNRFAAWPWAVLGTSTTTSFPATGHLTDGATHYYIIRAVRGTAESLNSTMGVKIQMNVGFSSTSSNIRWFSLPFRSDYTKASDIATELGSSKIDVVAKWNPATQAPILYYYFRGAWRGTDFSIAAGDGLYIGSVSAFSWVVVGNDRPVSLSFTFNSGPLGNVNWLSLPFTGTYALASDLVRQIEGGTGPGTNTKITEVVKWNAATQTIVRYFYTAGGWSGADFSISPGDGIYFRITSSFTWTPSLITPEVP